MASEGDVAHQIKISDISSMGKKRRKDLNPVDQKKKNISKGEVIRDEKGWIAKSSASDSSPTDIRRSITECEIWRGSKKLYRVHSKVERCRDLTSKFPGFLGVLYVSGSRI